MPLQLDKATSGQIVYRGQDITKLGAKEKKKEIQIIFQDPFIKLRIDKSYGTHEKAYIKDEKRKKSQND
jgi:ABC-type oligopeptide transport system ATPase subunit